MKEIYNLIYNFKIDKKFWQYDNLTGDDYIFRRSKPAPYLKTTIKIAKLLGLKNVVEIGSTRYAASQKCIDFYNLENEAFVAPPCCSDGHCGFFFAENGFELYTVDIDEHCATQNKWSYNNVGKDFPNNIHLEIPRDGIEFLQSFEGKIDILFLDGWDKGTLGYAEKHLEAFEAAKDKLSEVHLVLIDDTDYITDDGGKDKILSPYLIENGYIPLFNGRQTLFINTTNVKIQEVIEEEIIQVIDEMEFELTEFPLVILSLSTTPNRLSEDRPNWGVRPTIERLLSLSYPNYEIHFNIPYINHKNNVEYVIPEWLHELARNDERLKLFRCHDYGSVTKLAPTILRVEDPETIIITVDDDIVYSDGFIEYHLKKQRFYPDCALAFAGIGSHDGSCHLCTTLKKDTPMKILEGYKTASYKRKFFENDFFTDFVPKSWSDDVIISAYLGKQKIRKIVMNYNKDTNFKSRVESFPVDKVVPNEKSGCNIYRSENVSDNSDYFGGLGYFNV